MTSLKKQNLTVVILGVQGYINKIKTVFKSKLRENSFVYPSVQLWNSAPSEITIETTESKAKKAIRHFVKTDIARRI